MQISLIHKLAVCCLILSIVSARYTPDWNSLDTRPLPPWYDEAKIGIFLHWGVFSVPSYGNEWFWWNWKGSPRSNIVEFIDENYPPDWTYADFAQQLRAELFVPEQWAQLFEAAGAKYVVLTTKHHEGFCLWPSANSWNWNAMDVGPNMDLVGALANAIRNNTQLKFGVYHSLFEWFNNLYIQDRESNFSTQDFVRTKTMPELYDLVNRYQPDVIWSDGDFQASYEYWNSTEFIAWLYNDSPVKDTVVVNDRWGIGSGCRHGDFFTCADNYNPGKLINHKWENCMPIDPYSWGYRRTATVNDIRSIEQIIASVAETISCGGNILINVGPTKDGIIVPIFQERLLQLGQWLSVNGEAIYASKPWKYQNDTINSMIWYTQNAPNVYAILLSYPQNNTVVLGAPVTTPSTKIFMLGYQNALNWIPRQGSGLVIDLSSILPASLPCQWAWVFKLENVN